MKKIRVLYAMDDPIEEEKKYILAGNEYPKTYLWWDFTDSYPEYELVFINNNKPRKGFLKFIEKITGFRNIPYQIDVIRKHKEYDVIFGSLDYYFFIVLFLRYLKVLKKPIFGYSHHSFNYKISTDKWYYKLRLRFLYHFGIKGVDYLCFNGETAYNKACEIHKFNKKNPIYYWGVDFDFYNNYQVQTNDDNFYFMTAGSAGRDYRLLINVFEELPYQLKIYQKLDDLGFEIDTIPENIIFNVKEKKEFQGFAGHVTLRKAYKESFAVIIALDKQHDGPMGITTLYEALACGKPVIVTDNIIFPIDVEKEGVGIKVAYGDKEGWIKAINYLVTNKNIAKKMGEKAYEFSKTKRNYSLYKKDMLKNFDTFIQEYYIPKKI